MHRSPMLTIFVALFAHGAGAQPTGPATAGQPATERAPGALPARPPARSPILAAPGTRTIKDVVYATVDGVDLRIDLFLPPEAQAKEGQELEDVKPVPAVVWIHGGGWSGGNKERAPTAILTRKGYVGVAVQYRLSGRAAFPAQIHDCKGAIRWLRAHAAEYRIDPERIGVWGASAGGHLVALLGTSGGVKELEGDVGGNLNHSSRVQAVCDWFGPTDLLRFFPADATQRDYPATGGTRMVVQLLGCKPNECKDKWMQVNPITHLSKDDAPVLIMHGDKDQLVPLSQSEIFEEGLKKVDVKVKLHVVKGAGHGFAGETELRMVSDFFDEHLKPGTPAAPAK